MRVRSSGGAVVQDMDVTYGSFDSHWHVSLVTSERISGQKPVPMFTKTSYVQTLELRGRFFTQPSKSACTSTMCWVQINQCHLVCGAHFTEDLIRCRLTTHLAALISQASCLPQLLCPIHSWQSIRCPWIHMINGKCCTQFKLQCLHHHLSYTCLHVITTDDNYHNSRVIIVHSKILQNFTNGILPNRMASYAASYVAKIYCLSHL